MSQRSRMPLPARRLTRLAAAATVTGLALAGCSSAGSGSTSAQSEPASPSASTVVVPPGRHLTAQGTNLSFGDTATVVFEPTKRTGTVLKMTVKAARKGRLSDFRAFSLDDEYKRKANYYYVDVSVQNVGDTDVGGAPVPLWGVNGDNTLLPAVSFTTDFRACPSKPFPARFGPGAELDTCLVYLSPSRGTLRAVSYRPSQEFNPIRWTGTVH